MGRIYEGSRWGKRTDPEAKYIKSILLLPAIYLELKSVCDEETATKLIDEITVKVSSDVDHSFEQRHGLPEIADPFERWKTYRNGLAAGGFGRFNVMEDVEVSENRMAYIVRRCIFHDCFSDAGVPELTHHICDYDLNAHRKLFPELEFSRDGSSQNSIGHGKEYCRYVWERK